MQSAVITNAAPCYPPVLFHPLASIISTCHLLRLLLRHYLMCSNGHFVSRHGKWKKCSCSARNAHQFVVRFLWYTKHGLCLNDPQLIDVSTMGTIWAHLCGPTYDPQMFFPTLNSMQCPTATVRNDVVELRIGSSPSANRRRLGKPETTPKQFEKCCSVPTDHCAHGNAVFPYGN